MSEETSFRKVRGCRAGSSGKSMASRPGLASPERPPKPVGEKVFTSGDSSRSSNWTGGQDHRAAADEDEEATEDDWGKWSSGGSKVVQKGSSKRSGKHTCKWCNKCSCWTHGIGGQQAHQSKGDKSKGKGNTEEQKRYKAVSLQLATLLRRGSHRRSKTKLKFDSAGALKLEDLSSTMDIGYKEFR